MNWEKCDWLYTVMLIPLASVHVGKSAGSEPGSGETRRELLERSGGLDACRRGEGVTGHVGDLF